jgi:hypothetical protein
MALDVLKKTTVFADLPRQSFGYNASFGPTSFRKTRLRF